MEEDIGRVRLPKEGEIFGIVNDFLGGDKVRVECNDNHIRICRIPGKLRKRIWMRVGDTVLVQPWKVQSDVRGDIIWVYKPTQTSWLKRQGYVK